MSERGRVHARYWTVCCRVEALAVALGRWACPLCGASFDATPGGGHGKAVRVLEVEPAGERIDDIPTADFLALARTRHFKPTGEGWR